MALVEFADRSVSEARARGFVAGRAKGPGFLQLPPYKRQFGRKAPIRPSRTGSGINGEPHLAVGLGGLESAGMRFHSSRRKRRSVAPRCLVQLDAVTVESCDAVDRRKVNALGRFTDAYDASHHLQLETVQAPNGVFNGVQTRFEYQTAAGRLRQITHRSPASPAAMVQTYSVTHQYTQSAGGEIPGWNQTLREPRGPGWESGGHGSL